MRFLQLILATLIAGRAYSQSDVRFCNDPDTQSISEAGLIPSNCDWSGGTEDNSSGKKYCIDLCNGKFTQQDACNGSRCEAQGGGYWKYGPDQSKKKPGQCYCTCACPPKNN